MGRPKRHDARLQYRSPHGHRVFGGDRAAERRSLKLQLSLHENVVDVVLVVAHWRTMAGHGPVIGPVLALVVGAFVVAVVVVVAMVD